MQNISGLSKKSGTAQKKKFPIKDFFSKCDQIRREMRVWLHLLKKSLITNFIFRAVLVPHRISSLGTSQMKRRV